MIRTHEGKNSGGIMSRENIAGAILRPDAMHAALVATGVAVTLWQVRRWAKALARLQADQHVQVLEHFRVQANGLNWMIATSQSGSRAQPKHHAWNAK